MTPSQLDHFSTPKHSIHRDICLLACGVELAENLASLLRLADAFGVKHVYFTVTNERILQKKVKRVSRSTVQTVPWSSGIAPIDCIVNLKKERYTVIALELTTVSQPLSALSINKNQKICFVVGNEKTGISDEVLSHIDQAVYIPMYGENSSINVAQASAIGLYHLRSCD